ncbi:hypothetical protein [Paraburkholderia gardini]|uniref:Uncharacterized protein n=1 Tax=Paraburkholderia gardini TaxID=2823469 RepID=A0ABN7QQX1_9BURK|nr:hypothetical protein [Paraburkholderia gardini]CAG4911447.1 hypothetical protein R54767_03793 [Paraburkholderia gardini]
MKKTVLYVGNLALTVIGAFFLVRLFLTLPFNMPDAVDEFLRAMLHIFGQDEMANPDDMEVLSVLLYFCIALIIVGFAVSGLNILFRRRCATWRGYRQN